MSDKQDEGLLDIYGIPYNPSYVCYTYSCRSCNYYFTINGRWKGAICKKCGKPMREKNLNPKPRKNE